MFRHPRRTIEPPQLPSREVLNYQKVSHWRTWGRFSEFVKRVLASAVGALIYVPMILLFVIYLLIWWMGRK